MFTPPAPEPVPAPSVPDVAVHLTVGDFIDRVPATLLSGGAVDRAQPVEFRSSELYSDLSKGRASVPASVIYAKCPDLFALDGHHVLLYSTERKVYWMTGELTAEMKFVPKQRGLLAQRRRVDSGARRLGDAVHSPSG